MQPNPPQEPHSFYGSPYFKVSLLGAVQGLPSWEAGVRSWNWIFNLGAMVWGVDVLGAG